MQVGFKLYSLYGSNRKPSSEVLSQIDIVLYDMQDVGVRFYTYISTMSLVMEACAEAGIPMVVLDRPNPLGYIVDGPVLKKEFSSFVGMHPVPVIYGMTAGEYAQMVNEEGWLKGGVKCDLTVVRCLNYDHSKRYTLPIAPSPNLPNMRSVYLYPSLCFFEGTEVSIGRGTSFPFQVYGHPSFTNTSFSFTPKKQENTTISPKHNQKLCLGKDLRGISLTSLELKDSLDLTWCINAYQDFEDKSSFFTSYFTTLMGNKEVQRMITANLSPREIHKSWKTEVDSFNVNIRKKYLLYVDF